MSGNENKKAPEELPDEALDQVAAGDVQYASLLL